MLNKRDFGKNNLNCGRNQSSLWRNVCTECYKKSNGYFAENIPAGIKMQVFGVGFCDAMVERHLLLIFLNLSG